MQLLIQEFVMARNILCTRVFVCARVSVSLCVHVCVCVCVNAAADPRICHGAQPQGVCLVFPRDFDHHAFHHGH